VSVTVDDELGAAVGDPTRRQMLDLLLTDGRGTATTLSGQLPVTRQAVAKHLGVVARVGLVHVKPAGRERVYQIDEAQLARAVAHNCRRSGRPGTLGCVASSGSPRRSSAARTVDPHERTSPDVLAAVMNRGCVPASILGMHNPSE
jgi:DNA-binding transcriptional ArsR family regulator